MMNPAYELQQTILDQCGNCVHLKLYRGSQAPDDPPVVSCGKDEFEFLHPECEWHDKECELKQID